MQLCFIPTALKSGRPKMGLIIALTPQEHFQRYLAEDIRKAGRKNGKQKNEHRLQEGKGLDSV